MAIVACAIGAVGGYVLGGVGPRTELARAEDEAERFRQDQEVRGATWRSPVPGLDRILRAPEEEPEGVRHRDEISDAGLDGASPSWRERWRERGEESAPARLEAFQRAAAVQRVRRVQSRAALVDQAELEDDEVQELDAILAQFDDDFSAHGEEILQLAARTEPPPARYLLGVTHDVTGVLRDAQIRLEELLGPERAAAVDPSALEIWNHVDLDRLAPAAESALRAVEDRR